MRIDYEIHSEMRAGHWVAWATSNADSKPAGAVLLVGQTQEEAEANAEQWVERITQDSKLLRTLAPETGNI
tara:strand:+ start:158 stop:370 length:213 start_codon:yes stop_codon:yes gene_type:complete